MRFFFELREDPNIRVPVPVPEKFDRNTSGKYEVSTKGSGVLKALQQRCPSAPVKRFPFHWNAITQSIAQSTGTKGREFRSIWNLAFDLPPACSPEKRGRDPEDEEDPDDQSNNKGIRT